MWDYFRCSNYFGLVLTALVTFNYRIVYGRYAANIYTYYY